MRDYGKVSPTFWTGDTGRRLRKMGPRVQLVALYLITGPHANMIGLYYMPLPVLCHETGIPLEGALKALASLSEGGFAWYDRGSEVVWIPEMARFQLGETVVPKDHKHKGLLRELEKYRKSSFFDEFYRRYRGPYHLPTPSPLEAPSKPLGSPRESAPTPLSSQEQEQEQEEEQEQDQEQEKKIAPFVPPTVPEVAAYIETRPVKIDPERFVDHYTANGWVQGRQGKPVVDWKACVRTWEKNNFGGGTNGSANGTKRRGGLRYDPDLHGPVTPLADAGGDSGPRPAGEGP